MMNQTRAKTLNRSLIVLTRTSQVREPMTRLDSLSAIACGVFGSVRDGLFSRVSFFVKPQ
jgi:hypothetical protein